MDFYRLEKKGPDFGVLFEKVLGPKDESDGAKILEKFHVYFIWS